MNEAIHETLKSLTALEAYPEWQPILDQIANSQNIDFANAEGKLFLSSFIKDCVKNAQLYNKTIQKHQEEYEDVKSEITDLREENNHLERMTQDLISQMKDLKDLMSHSDQFSKELRERGDDLMNENKELRNQLEDIRSDSQSPTKDFTSPKKQPESDEVSLTELQNRIFEKELRIEDLLRDFNALEAEKNALEIMVNGQKDDENLHNQKSLAAEK